MRTIVTRPTDADNSYRTFDLGSHRLQYLNAKERQNHCCYMCYRDKVYEEGKRKGKPVRTKGSIVFCVFCQKVLCTECWPKWHS
eukprot:COSAG05_NODE_1823_length_4012_cov_2.059290_3_plen_84_part_00